MISAVVLAAGSSSRMGSPKCLLKIGGKTFLQYIVDVLSSARILDIVVVLGADAEELGRSLDWFKGTVVVNTDWQRGQLTSIIRGIDALNPNDLHGAIICPVDRPLISQSLIVALLQSFWKSKKNIVVPTYHDRRGHPVIFAAKLFDELRAAPLDVGARAVTRLHPEEVAEIATDEEGVLLNIDTPEDYQRHVLERAHRSERRFE